MRKSSVAKPARWLASRPLRVKSVVLMGIMSLAALCVAAVAIGGFGSLNDRAQFLGTTGSSLGSIAGMRQSAADMAADGDSRPKITFSTCVCSASLAWAPPTVTGNGVAFGSWST